MTTPQPQVFRFDVSGFNSVRGQVASATVFAPNEATARQQWEACQRQFRPTPSSDADWDDAAWEWEPEWWSFTKASEEPVNVWGTEVVNFEWWVDGDCQSVRGRFQQVRRAWEAAGRPSVWCVWS